MLIYFNKLINNYVQDLELTVNKEIMTLKIEDRDLSSLGK